MVSVSIYWIKRQDGSFQRKLETKKQPEGYSRTKKYRN